MSRITFLRKKNFALVISLASTLPTLNASAEDSHTIFTPQGQAIFQIKFFDLGDGTFESGDDDGQRSLYTLSNLQKQQLLQGFGYWATVLQPQPGQLPARFNVGTDDSQDNAAASSDSAPSDDSVYITQVQAALTNRPTGDLDHDAHGFVIVGPQASRAAPYTPSQLPLPATTDELVTTGVHELAHALGISSSASDKFGRDSVTPYFDSDSLSSWTAALRDDNGNAARPGQAILCEGCNNEYSSDAFDVRKDQGYFAGEQVSEVLAGAMPGIPVRMLTSGMVDNNYMSHIELKNSLMSHQYYRNYSVFMEAELAVLQDMGYSIDRRNLFGYSVYGDGQTLHNQNGYYKRNDEGIEYLVGAYNGTAYGLGLHVYGSNNLIYQQADLMSNGAGGAGIRIDGQSNTLTVESSTRIKADGLNGRGVIFAYGKDHDFIQRGDVQALGERGIAAEFNFGTNMLGTQYETRGSYIRTVQNAPAQLLPELQGALVNNADISGRLAGSAAAISISDNALVNHINILSGAQLEGGIVSAYNQLDENGKQRLTHLTFGHLADSDGRALTAADSSFRFSYGNNIDGIHNLAIEAVGGTTTLNGSNKVYSVDVAQGATLDGTGTYTLNKAGAFVNAGTVAPHSTITVQGDYTQTSSGQLLLEVNDKGQHDTLAVSGKAKLDGQLTLAAEPGWYAPDWKLNTANLLKAGSTEGTFSQFSAEIASPTLTLLSTSLANGSYDLSLHRTATAYSQYAQSRNAAALGEALSNGATPNASADRQKLYTTLDFSAADGSTVATALEQLSPSAYSAMVASSVQREQQVADAISKREPGRLALGQWQTFIQPFGGNTRQNGDSHTIGYTSNSDGLIFGAETAVSSDSALIVGLHGAASKQTVSLKDPLNGSGSTTALELGAHVRYALDPTTGPYMLGSARVGYEEGELKRKLNFADYSAQNKADWNGTSASVVGGGGYRFAVNENVSVGPIATLTYTNLWRDDTHE
jgi:hypothetical protein